MADPVLAVGQFDLDGYTFGGDEDPVVIPPGGFDPGVMGWRTQDAENPVGDNMFFGRDRLTPPTWGFTLQTNTEGAPDALGALEVLAGKWRADSIRKTPGLVVPLRYNLGNGTRRVYGRPRRYAPAISKLLWQGVTSAVSDFSLAHTEFYDDTQRVVDLGILPGTTRGITSPLTGSLSTLLAGEKSLSVGDVGGVAPAPFVAVIYGPVQKPWLREDGWRIDLDVTLNYDQYAVIDTRPWACTVTRNDGAPLSGRLSRYSRLQEARLKPGGTVLRFGGKDATGTSHCTVAWRPTYYSI